MYKQQVKALFKNLSKAHNEASRMSVETGPYDFHAYLKKLAFQYLEDLKIEFERKTKKLYQDTRTQMNIAKLNDELYEVHQTMTRNVKEVLSVGEKLDRFNLEVGSYCHCV
ncbi:hypothetical protein Q3G72_007493 [Acer saccharum]|nr:hypothetical protein Q3G72_007493 [Acer saccharum]